ncbi:FecCD family ABC transporter permease [Nocardia seriolae]|uniref:Transporter permease n=1 Tax=Nocardia seriolae TaxID=37332 RepID=A0A0B8ND33_9NOCA|nr:iron ABC transporter permease [Nocardia seriolae]APA97503.1 Vitamin B12 import system permease protein BtuC [Nocardia seriolae]MTJ62398.1 iron chelate uptake ABC transporter family permease subunit [Nocardia seriolae]MTJ72956.1 iron chelate uptake ABC transporter family permease subunit [Nocardia seriolae]MTJ87304.1 iron chelate uptake ABC transporter family permease subunit [Nocardia seriolae]MTK31298.1 iron chelate uptake ABC transporter family permease subunit [Nocardia seriolae]
MSRARTSLALPVMGLLLLAAMVVATGFGAENIPLRDVVEVLRQRITGGTAANLGLDTIVWQLRVPRTILAAIVGAGLAIAGAAMQTLVRNPLADPYLLGVSSGAGVGAAAVITSGLFAGAGMWALSAGALAGALLAAAAVFLIAMAQGGLTPLRLVLTGTVLGSAFAAFSSYLIFRSSEPSAAQSVLFWLLGSLAGADWTRILLPSCVVAAALAALLTAANWLDALNLGPDTAASLGVPVRELRIALFILLAVLVGILVAVSGGIGFVGLVVPHAARLLIGPRHRTLLPASALCGATFLVVADAATRILVRPTEIPVGVLTGLIGAPAFLFLMGRRTYRFGAA